MSFVGWTSEVLHCPSLPSLFQACRKAYRTSALLAEETDVTTAHLSLNQLDLCSASLSYLPKQLVPEYSPELLVG